MIPITKKISLIILILNFGFSVFSQEILWVKETWGDQLNPGIAIDEFDNLYISDDYSLEQTFGGTTLPVDGNINMFLIKYSPNGQINWTINSTTSGSAHGRSISVSNESGIFFTGVFDDDIEIQDFYLEANNIFSHSYYGKTNEGGNLLWLKRISSPSSNWFQNSQIDADDNLILTGRFRYPITFDDQTINGQNGPGSGSKYCISKFNSDGEFQWLYDFYGLTNLQIKIDQENNILFGGEFQNYLTYGQDTIFSEGHIDVTFGKLDSSGNLLWIKTLAGPDTEILHSIENTLNDEIVMFNSVDSTSQVDSIPLDFPDNSYLLTKFSSAGEIIWHLSPPKLNDSITVYNRTILLDSENNPVLFGRNFYLTEEPFFEEIEIGTIKQTIDINTGQILSQGLYPNIPMPQHIISSLNNQYYFYNQYYEEVTIDTTTFSNDYYGSFIGKIKDLYTSTLTIDQQNNFIVYPNPTSGIVNILPKPLDFSTWYSIFDTNGNLILKTRSNINISHLPCGMYILRITNKKNSSSFKLLKY